MNDLLAQLHAINVFKDVMVPAAAALFAVWIATRKFKRERLWQDKYESYQRVIESVEAIRYWGDETSSNAHMLPAVGDFGGKTSYEFYASAQREVVKQTSVGTLLLSSSFVAKLKEFNTELNQERFTESEEHYYDERAASFGLGSHASKIRDISARYLSQLILLARKELGA